MSYRALILAALCGWTTSVVAVDFPPPLELPVRPGLPDPLVSFYGDPVDSLDKWQTRRIQELKDLFQHYMYGYFPDAPKELKYTLVQEIPDFFNGKAVMREVDVDLGVPGAPVLHLLVVTPKNSVKNATPVFVGLNFVGNHTTCNDPRVRITQNWVPARYPGCANNVATEESRGCQADRWMLEQTIDRGYAVVTCYMGDIDPDKPDFTDGVHPYFFTSDDAMERWGSITAWAWGMMRMVDYIYTVEEFDTGRIIAYGHSRLGKTALLAGAFDPRFAVVIPHQSGTGGAAPSRHLVGESVARINQAFPHWFCGYFKAFGVDPNRLPFDQNCLIALCAPRPVLCTNAVEDEWADPSGQFDALIGASPVYRLFGEKGVLPDDKPPVGELLTNKLGYFIREGKHTVTAEDWNIFCDYADFHLGKPE